MRRQALLAFEISWSLFLVSYLPLSIHGSLLTAIDTAVVGNVRLMIENLKKVRHYCTTYLP